MRLASLLAAILAIGEGCSLTALRADDAQPLPVVHYRPETPADESTTTSTSTPVVTSTSAMGDDAAIKKKLLGVWTGGRYDHRLGADGVLYENDRASCKWDVKGGRYYEVLGSAIQPDNVYDILVLTPNVFCYRFHPDGAIVTWTRLGPNGGRITTSTPASAIAPYPGSSSASSPVPTSGAPKLLTWGEAPQAPVAMKDGDTANRPVIGDPSALKADNADDLELKKKLLGYWQGARHDYAFTTDGFCYMMQGATTTTAWDIRNGVFYEYQGAYDIISLTADKFVFRGRDSNRAIYTQTRITQQEAEQYTY